MNDLECDVLVVGGGVTGVAAATAAARAGARTLLLEARPFVGGNATTGLCLHNYVSKQGKQVVFGIAQEVVDRMIDMGGAVGHIPFPDGFCHSITPVDGEYFRIMSTEMLADAGVQILYGVNVVGVQTDGREITSVQAAVKGGIRNIRAKTYLDASGDADLVSYAGGGVRLGDQATGKMQPVSMLLHFHGVDTRRIAQAIGVSEPAMATRKDSDEPIPVYFRGSFSRWNDVISEQGIFPNKDHMVFFNTVWPDQINVNTSAVFGIDGTDPVALSRASVELTKQAAKIGGFLKENVPGFENGYLVPASFAQVRQTRVIEALYEISDEDALEGRKFDDTIGQVCFPIDIHDPDTGQASFYPIGDDGTFDIPFRSMVPTALDNVIVAGRCIAATHMAYGATRNMAPCLVTGEAAGVAAAQAAAAGVSIPDLDVGALQRTLRANGVYLGEAFA